LKLKLNIKVMFEVYYFNNGVYHFQSRFSTLSAAKDFYNDDYPGYIKKGDRILKRYKGCE